MEKSVLLLPFVHGIDFSAISSALGFAHEANATLLLVSLIPLHDRARKQAIRAEMTAQTYDFFEVVKYKAARAGVAIRCIQLSTHHSARSIYMLAQEMSCLGILLFVREGSGVLLETGVIKQLLEQKCQPIYLFRLSPRRDWISRGWAWLIGCLKRPKELMRYHY